jgi:hypothetical protein
VSASAGETFETSITWDRFEQLYEAVREQAGRAIPCICGQDASVSCCLRAEPLPRSSPDHSKVAVRPLLNGKKRRRTQKSLNKI